MNDQHLSEHDICLYVDALKLNRTDDLPPGLREHVASCLECKQEIMQLHDALKLDDYSDAGEHPNLGSPTHGKESGRALIYRIAATLVLIVGLGVVAYNVFLKTAGTGTHPTSVHQAAATSQNQQADKALQGSESFAENFTPSPNLEDLVGSNFRSASIEVESPVNGQAISGDIAFRWKSQGKGSFEVRIMTNKDEKIFARAADQSEVEYTGTLDPGLYYWTILDDGEVIYVGKFTVPLR